MKRTLNTVLACVLAVALVFQLPFVLLYARAAEPSKVVAQENVTESNLTLHYDNLDAPAIPLWQGNLDMTLSGQADGDVLAVRMRVSDSARLTDQNGGSGFQIGLSTAAPYAEENALLWNNVPVGALKANEWVAVYLPMSSKYCQITGLDPAQELQIKSARIQPTVSAGGSFNLEISGFQVLRQVKKLYEFDSYQNMTNGCTFVNDAEDWVTGPHSVSITWSADLNTGTSTPALAFNFKPGEMNLGSGEQLTLAYKTNDPTRISTSAGMENGIRLLLCNWGYNPGFYNWGAQQYSRIPTEDMSTGNENGEIIANEWNFLHFDVSQMTPLGGKQQIQWGSVNSGFIQFALTQGSNTVNAEPFKVSIDSLAVTKLEDICKFTTVLPMEGADPAYFLPGSVQPAESHTIYGFDTPTTIYSTIQDSNHFKFVTEGMYEGTGALSYHVENTVKPQGHTLPQLTADCGMVFWNDPLKTDSVKMPEAFTLMAYCNDPSRIVTKGTYVFRIMLSNEGTYAKWNGTDNMLLWNIPVDDLKPNQWCQIRLPFAEAQKFGNFNPNLIRFMDIQITLQESQEPFTLKLDLLGNEIPPKPPVPPKPSPDPDVVYDFPEEMTVNTPFSVDKEICATEDYYKSSLKLELPSTTRQQGQTWQSPIPSRNMSALRFYDGLMTLNMWCDDFARLNKVDTTFALRLGLSSTRKEPIWNQKDHTMIWNMAQLPDGLENNQWNQLTVSTDSADVTNFGQIDYANVNFLMLQQTFAQSEKPITVRFDDLKIEAKEADKSRNPNFDHSMGVLNDGFGGTAAGEGTGWNGADGGKGWAGIDPNAKDIITSITPNEFVGFTATLKNNISLNFLIRLGENVKPDDFMRFTIPNQNQVVEVPVKNAQYLYTQDAYLFSCPMVAKEMADSIHAEMVVDGLAVKETTYSIRDYAMSILENQAGSYSAKDVDMAVAMLNYGAAAQQHFNYYAEDLANKNLTEEQKMCKSDSTAFSGYEATTTGPVNGIQWSGSTLNLVTDTEVFNYFQLDSDQNIDNFTFERVNSDKTTAILNPVQRSSGEYRVTVGPYFAADLDKVFVLRVTNHADNSTMEIVYGPYVHANRMLQKGQKDIVLAMADYCNAAKACIQ